MTQLEIERVLNEGWEAIDAKVGTLVDVISSLKEGDSSTMIAPRFLLQ